MKSVFTFATIAVFAATTSAMAATESSTAMEIAVAQQACGEDGTIVSARFLEDGRVGVRCSDGAGGFLSGAGGSGAAIAGLFTLVLGAAALGDSSSTSDTQ